jgi:glycosyltransferase involved in cell wall biosynthesis
VAKPVTGIVVPAHNEARTVGRVVREIRAAVPGAHVVVVDDRSRDATAAAARAAGAEVVTTHNGHGGYAQALQRGYEAVLEAGAERIAQVDADGQHTAGDLLRLLAGLDRYDLVVGSRFLGPGYHMPVTRRFGITLCRWMSRHVGRLPLTDPTSGFRAVRPGVAAEIAANGFPDGLTEVSYLIRLHRAGYTIGEVPVTMQPPHDGSMHDGFAGVVHFGRIVRATAGLAWNHRQS